MIWYFIGFSCLCYCVLVFFICLFMFGFLGDDGWWVIVVCLGRKFYMC